MEPKTLSNLNGTLVGSDSPFKLDAQMSPSKEFLNLDSSPASVSNDTIVIDSPAEKIVTFAALARQSILATPLATPSKLDDADIVGDKENRYATPPAPVGDLTSDSLSPTTPYFLHPAKLVQQTCPPKQTQQPLFPRDDERAGERKNEGVNRRLELVRRKSLQWAPKVGSPLRGGF